MTTAQRDNLPTILIADDDPYDRMFMERACRKARLRNPIASVQDGDDLLDYLRGEGMFAADPPPTPGLILLDLNMPRMDGHEALEELRQDPRFKRTPVILLTHSDIIRDEHASLLGEHTSCATKPVTPLDLIQVIDALGCDWFEPAERP